MGVVVSILVSLVLFQNSFRQQRNSRFKMNFQVFSVLFVLVAVCNARTADKKCTEYGTKGIAATTNERFYVSKVQIYKNKKYVSDGHIISENFVITPASENFGENADHIRKGTGKPVEKYEIEEVFFHPKYIDGSLDNDIALVKLKSAPSWHGKSKIQCLATVESFNQSQILQDHDEPVTKLMKSSDCSGLLKTVGKFKALDTSSQICTSDCLAREIIIKPTNSQQYKELAAISAFCDEDEEPAVFTSVYPYLDWIESVVWK